MLVVVLLALLSGVAPDQVPWWYNAVYYRLDVDSFKDMDGDGLGDLPGTAKQLSYVKALGVDAVILSSISEKSKDCSKPGITNFAEIDQRYGNLNGFNTLLQKAKKIDLKLLVSLDLRTISSESEWFKSSASREKGFEDQMVWTNGEADNVPQPRGKDMWVWNEDRKEYWASSGNEALLNLCSESVGTAFSNIQCTWIKRGVAGILYSPDFSLNDDCGVRLVRRLVTEGRNCARAANLDAPVILVESVLEAEIAAKHYGEGDVGANSVITYVLATPTKLPAADLALALHAALLFAPQDTSPAWLTSQIGNSRTTIRYGAEMVDSINLLALILPGAAVIQQGDELGAADTILEWATNNTCWPRKITPSAAPFPWDDSPKAGFTNGEAWLPLAPNYRYANAKTEYANDLSHVGVLRAAAAMRKTPAIGPHVETSQIGNSRTTTRYGAEMVDSINLLALILPGAAVIQQGDELGAADTILEWATNNTCWPRKITPSAAPFPWDDSPKAGFTNGEAWLPLAPNYRYANAKTEYANDLSHVGVLRAAAAMRKTPAIGPHVEIKRLGNIVAILRWGGSGSLLYVSNFGKFTSEAQLSRVPGLPAEMTVAASSGSSSLPPATHVTTEKGVRLGPGEAALLVGAPRHCSGPGPVDKIANKLTEGWQKINKYFSNL